MQTKEYIKSPLNYTGGKYKILNQIIPLFPKEIDTFIDLFGGGFNVGINVQAEHVIYNDIVTPLCDLMEYFSKNTFSAITQALEENIQQYNLSKTNESAFLLLRNKYNHFSYNSKNQKSLDFYTLILYSFNYQIRFNQKMEYNTPFGKNRSSYNATIKQNLEYFIDKLNTMDVKITNLSYDEIDLKGFSRNDLLYCDPPYLITTGSYNDGNRGIKNWTEANEEKLLSILDELNRKGIRFALSNAFTANGRENKILTQWSQQYIVHKIDNTFNNSNYHRRHKGDLTEVLITNYEVNENV